MTIMGIVVDVWRHWAQNKVHDGRYCFGTCDDKSYVDTVPGWIEPHYENDYHSYW